MGGKRQKGQGGDHAKKKRSAEDDVGIEQDGQEDTSDQKGFLVVGGTCQNALRGTKDLRLWLEVEAPPSADAAEEVCSPGGGAVTAAAGLEAELAELRNLSDSAVVASRRFLQTGMVCRQVSFLKLQHKADVPSNLAAQFLPPKASRRFVSRFAERVFPVDSSTKPKRQELDKLAEGLLSPHVGRTWRLVYEPFRGGWNTISKEDAMSVCKEVLKPEQMSISEPQVTVICTVTPKFVGLAALVGADLDDLSIEADEE